MAHSSILGGDAAPARPRGTGTDLLGPSDSSDSGSDSQHERAFATDTDGGAGALPAELDADTDAAGTGERGAAIGVEARDGDDILPDRVVRADDALDESERIERVDSLTADNDNDNDNDNYDDAEARPDAASTLPLNNPRSAGRGARR
ncbi:MAG: hypothetical protein KF891_03770 [Rhizobacter sp.]|nr:hypothetical protein [Rhizobacter sp.]